MRPYTLIASAAFRWITGKSSRTSSCIIYAPDVLRSLISFTSRAVAITLSPRLSAAPTRHRPKPDEVPINHHVMHGWFLFLFLEGLACDKPDLARGEASRSDRHGTMMGSWGEG